MVDMAPKPGKPADTPSNLRPISLTEDGGRIVIKAVTACLRPFFTDATRLWSVRVPARSMRGSCDRPCLKTLP